MAEMVRITVDFNNPPRLTDEQIKELEEAARYPPQPDDECPEITPDLIGTRYIPVDRKKMPVAG